ncbi:crotonase/enoyl-CoA hydratase family protein [Alphaproteobacteria bacterium]|nr:crotonase/enoyl-CoA hydratase family protein [Alphaproteobacteria bacterium]
MTVEIEKNDDIWTIVLHRPEVRNAVDQPTRELLQSAFDEFDGDANARVGVLWGKGGHFCSGADLKAMSDPSRRKIVDPEGKGPGPMGPTRTPISKPVIAAVSGYAVAGGLELALWCDLRVAEDNAVFGVYCRRWGVPLIDGGTVRLPRLIGHGRAMDMILTGRPVNADEALAIGLANRVVKPGASRSEAERLAREIAAFPQECMKADRHSTINQWSFSIEEALQIEGKAAHSILEREAFAGAERFALGRGRGGRFDDHND